MVAAMHAHGSSAHVGAEVGALVAGRVSARTRWRALCARAARFPVGRRQGRGLGQACAGVRGEFARTAGVGRGELGANVGMAHFWRSWMVAKRADQKRALSSRCPGPSEFLPRYRTVVRPLPYIKKRSTLGVAVNGCATCVLCVLT